jgi:hypothetical protein
MSTFEAHKKRDEYTPLIDGSSEGGFSARN